jgi:hypothetical protein
MGGAQPQQSGYDNSETALAVSIQKLLTTDNTDGTDNRRFGNKANADRRLTTW